MSRNPLLLSIVAASICVTAVLLGDPAGKAEPAKVAGNAWQDEPACRVVFFATLEGLYEDGVQDEAVDGILRGVTERPEEIKPRDSQAVSPNFVHQCPVCYPVLDALRLYRGRPAFYETGGKRRTLGPGLPKGVVEELKTKGHGDNKALQGLVRTWVERYVRRMDLPGGGKEALQRRLAELGRQAMSPWYGVCPSCTGVVEEADPKK